MRLYLVRHGESLNHDSDPVLSIQGKSDVKLVAEFLARSKAINVVNIFHSVKKRAKETAEIIGNAVNKKSSIQEIANLKPNDDPAALLPRINSLQADAMIVGHLPYMDKLLSLFIMGEVGYHLLEFEAGSVVCLEKNIDDRWIIKWAIAPKL